MTARLALLTACQCMLSLLMLTPPSIAAAQEPDYTIDITRDFLRRAIESSVEQSLSTMPGVGWASGERIEMDYNGGIEVVANLLLDSDVFLGSHNVPTPEFTPDVIEVEVSFQMSLSCRAYVPELVLSVGMVDVDVGFSLAIEILTGRIAPILSAIGSELIDRFSDIPPMIESKITERIRREFDLGTLESCPWIVLHDDCSYTLEFGGPNSCTNGDMKTETCGIGQIFYLCVNGKWEFQDMTCF